MRGLVSSILVGLLVASCGSDSSGSGDGESTGGSDNGNGGGAVEPNYPDSLCTDSGCAKGGCDKDGKDDSMPDCNAWQILGTFSFQAAVIDEKGTPGVPMPPMRSDEDLCPANTRTPDNAPEKHCCQNVTKQSATPTYRLTSLTMNTPPIFGGAQVSTTNKEAIEDNRYNWVMSISSDQDGDVEITSGLGLLNVDGSFRLANGPFSLGGEMWNTKGEWDPHKIPATLTTNADGTHKLSYKGQYLPPPGRTFELPMWGKGYDFTMLVLSMTGIEMAIDLSPDMICGGYLKGPSTFDAIGKMTAYLPLEPLKDVVLHFKKGDSGIGLCALTSQTPSGTCDKPLKDW